ncbi:hypothetical protein F3J02_11030 [Acinetobacter sp. Tr-809]|uniref:hypothetical protein n=1 Tax=Acinetobacter sp. Tr-809 TaxID=2608324 RepID=UPI00141DD711|nr:hypothetical protein [Acinetobacter sp. Tr-809]NIE97001.1 hypothetical protein [Acinetobacter sp. Tr-809]
MTSENNFVPSQAELIKIIESYVIFNIINSFTSPNRFNPKIYKITDEITLKAAIYRLHDAGDFRETEEQRIKRLDNKPIVIRSAEESMSGFNDQYEKDLSHYKPNHYHEVLTSIRNFWNAVELKDEEKINIFFNETLSIYAKHSDCNNPKVFLFYLKDLLEKKIGLEKLIEITKERNVSNTMASSSSIRWLNLLGTKELKKLLVLIDKKNLLSYEEMQYMKNLLDVYSKIQRKHARSITDYSFNRIFKQPFFDFVENFIRTNNDKFYRVGDLYKHLDQCFHPTIKRSIKSEIERLEQIEKNIGINIKNTIELISLNQPDRTSSLQSHPILNIFEPTSFHHIDELKNILRSQNYQLENLIDTRINLENQYKKFDNGIDIVNGAGEIIRSQIRVVRSRQWLEDRPDLVKQLKELFITKKSIT